MLAFLLVSGLLSFASADGASSLLNRLKSKRGETIQKAEELLNQNEIMDLKEEVEQVLTTVSN
jgi:hypothetical protein